MVGQTKRARLLVLVVAYNAEGTIDKVLQRIPAQLNDLYDVEVLVIDDSSKDRTFERGEAFRANQRVPFTLRILFNPVNQGYGGNQKIGFHYAIQEHFDFVALLHGDGQYAPECLPDLVRPLALGEADAVFGSRMMTKGGARSGGMPVYKFVGNKTLTWFQNRILWARLTEFHSGYRAYSVNALRRIPFHLNTNVFHFDTEIIIQLLIAGMRIKELPIPTYYGDEICYVNGWRYAFDVILTTLKARAQEMSLLYDRKYDCRPGEHPTIRYAPKLGFRSTHSLAVETVKPDSRVLDLGCAGGYVGAELRKKGCCVTGVDVFPLAEGIKLDAFIHHDMNAGPPPIDLGRFDYVLMLDVLEHLRSPERFVEDLMQAMKFAPETKLVVSTGNVGFVLTRVGLLVGQFNYGRRGILDMSHTRLFTFSTFRRFFAQAGIDVLEVRGVPAPFPLALRNQSLAHGLLAINDALIRLCKSLFGFQAFMVLKPKPSLPYLLREAEAATRTMKRCDATDGTLG